MQRKNIFERYKIEIPASVDAFNLMSVDYGDGEVTAAVVEWDFVHSCFTYKDLVILEDGVTCKVPNAYYISENYETLVSFVTSSDKDMGNRYYNFKKCPGTKDIDSAFLKDDGMSAELTYGEVMMKGFNILMHKLFKNNWGLLHLDKPTIVIVGRPSSNGWAGQEMAYARLLQKGLDMSDVTKEPIYVAVESEALSALAREIDPRWGEKSVERGAIVVILDNGSSTFDITVIGKDGIPQNGEDSYQFGGNLIDGNLYTILEKEVENTGKEIISKHGHKLGLRIKKEEYYGPTGESLMKTVYTANLRDKPDDEGQFPQSELSINSQTMERAMEKMPVKAYHLQCTVGDAVFNKQIPYGSWLEGCREIYKAFYDKTSSVFVKDGDAAHPKVPDRVIMTGGVSVMPEVKKIAEEVFGVAPVLAQRPNYSVSEGLAYVLSCEVRKMLLLKELKQEMKNWLPDEEELRNDIASCGADWVWGCISACMEEWIENSEYHSIQKMNDKILSPLWKEKYRHHLEVPLQNGCEKWYQDNRICEQVNERLQKRFAKLFPRYADEFKYELPDIVFKSMKGVKVRCSVAEYDFFFLDLDYSEQRPQPLNRWAIRDRSWKNRAYQHLREIKNEIYNGGTHKYYHYVEVSYGIFGMFSKTKPRLKYEFSYSGLINDFKKEITHEVANDIRREIEDLLCKQMEDYVEAITPYFMMSEKQITEAK